ncbi:MAG: DNA primase [Planctomycetes bacterium]|nr:DNA primase [Planctomycetota bacterium]
MVQLVGDYVPGGLQARGQDDHWGRCPFHEEQRPSFHITPSKGFYKCFGCGKGGDIFRFVEEVEGVNFPEALRRLAERAGVRLEPSSPEERAREARRAELLRASEQVAAFYERVLWSKTPAGERGRQMLAARGITEETARAFRLGVAPGFTPDGRFPRPALPQLARERDIPLEALLDLGLLRQKEGGRPYDFFRDRLMFPIADEQGKVVAFGGRTLGEDERKYMNSPEVPGVYEKRKVLYGLDRARKARPKRLVVVEGYVDVVVPHQAGHRDFVASLGTALTPEQARLARRYVDEVVLLFDGDAAGVAATQRALANLVGETGLRFRVAKLPAGEDPDDLVRRDPAALEQVLEAAEDLIAFLIGETLRGPGGSQEQAVRAAIRLLGRIDDRVALFMELKKVAERFGLPEQVLRDETVKAQSEAQAQARSGRAATKAPGGRATPRAGAPAKDDVETKLLEALLAVPDAAAQLTARGVDPAAWSAGPARRVAEAVFAAAAEQGAADPAAVLARLDDPAARDLAHGLVGRLDPGKNYVKELEGVEALAVRTRQRRLQELTRELRQTKDPQATDRLLAEHKRLRTEIEEARARQVARAR